MVISNHAMFSGIPNKNIAGFAITIFFMCVDEFPL
jgi:hypothetical protein